MITPDTIRFDFFALKKHFLIPSFYSFPRLVPGIPKFNKILSMAFDI